MERASKVQLMQRIYTEATFVVAWLGPDDVEVSCLLNLIKHASDTIKVYRSGSITGERTQDVVEEDLMSKLVHIPDVDPNLTLKELYSMF